MQKVQIINHSSPKRLRRTPRKRSDDITPPQTLETLRTRSPYIRHTQQQTAKDKNGPFAKVVCEGNPEEIEDAEDEDGPEEEIGRLNGGFVEFLAQDEEGWGEAADGEICEKGKCADGRESDVLLVAGPAEGIVWVGFGGVGEENEC